MTIGRKAMIPGLSGNAYVPAVERIDESNSFKLRIVSPRNCNHETTICKGELDKDDNSLAYFAGARTCIESWQLDWKLLFNRTAGGRSLKEWLDARATV